MERTSPPASLDSIRNEMHLESMECGIGEIKLHHRKRGSCLIFTNEKDLCRDVISWCGYYLILRQRQKHSDFVN